MRPNLKETTKKFCHNYCHDNTVIKGEKMNHKTLTKEEQLAKFPRWVYNPYAESRTAYQRNNDVTKPAEDYFYWLSQMNKASI